jgi:antitoxin HicB
MDEAERERRIIELLKLPYRKVIRGDAADGFLAEVPELPGCMTDGETAAEALQNLSEAMAAWFESALEHGDPIPEPWDPDARQFSGRLLVRMPRSLHRRLAERAEEEGVSLNQLAVAAIAEQLGG